MAIYLFGGKVEMISWALPLLIKEKTMKVKKLIELLQKFDDDGEVCIATEDGNVDIFHLEEMAGYWDGAYQVLERDWTNEFYNVTGAKYRSDGSKIVIKPMGIEDALLDNIDLPIEVIDKFVNKRMQKQVDAWRKEAKDIHSQVEKWQRDREKEQIQEKEKK